MRVLLCLAAAAVACAQSLPRERVVTSRNIKSEAAVGSISFSADGSLLAGFCEDHKVRLWDSRTGELKRTVPVNNEEAAIAMITDPADLLASAKSGKRLGRAGNAIPQTRQLIASPGRKLLAGASRISADGSEFTVRIWDASGKERLALPAGLGGVSTLAFSPNGHTLVAGGFDTNLRVWSTRDGELLRLLDELPLTMFASAFSPDGKYLATGGADRIVYLLDTKTWKIARKLSGQPEMISALAFSPDSRLLLTGGFSEFTQRNPVKALLWDVSTGTTLRSVGSAQMVVSAAFSPDGARAATASLDGTVSIWAVP